MFSMSDGVSFAVTTLQVLFLVMLVATITVAAQNVYDHRRDIVYRREQRKEEQIQVNRILKEIEEMQVNARALYEKSSSTHDKAKALYAYEHISECLGKFEPIKIKDLAEEKSYAISKD